MAWVRIDENFTEHPKAIQAGPLAIAMQVAALCYCNRHLTDGFIPRAKVPTLLNLDGLASWESVVQSLLDAGMWEETEGGYRIHDYLDYQPSRAQVLAEREQKREAGRKGGQASAQARAQAGAQADGQAPAQAKSKPVPDPVPVPDTVTVTDPKEDSSSLRSEHASRVGGNGSSLRSEHAEPPEEISNQALIAELVAEYRSIPGIEPKKGDYAFVGRLYNDYGYDEVLTALQELRVSQEFEPKQKPLVWLKAVLQRRAQEQSLPRRGQGKEPPQFQVIRNWLARTGADPPEAS